MRCSSDSTWRLVPCQVRTLVALAVLAALQTAWSVASRAAEGELTAEAFLALPQEARLQVLGAALQDRAGKLENVRGDIVIQRYNAAWDGAAVGKTVKPLDSFEQTFRAIGNSYRFDHRYTSARGDGSQLFESISAYDAQSGVGTMFASHSQLDHPTARIDHRKDPVTRDNYFAYHLSGWIDDARPSYLRYALDNLAGVRFDDAAATGDLVAIEIAKNQPDGARDVRRYWINVAKNWIIERAEYRWDRTEPDGSRAFDHRDDLVLETTPVSGTHLARRTRLVGRSQHLPQGQATVYDIEARKLELGSVRPEDLKIEFPRGTEVNNMLEQKVYFVGQEKLAWQYGDLSKFPGNTAAASGWTIRNIAIAANLAIFAVLAILVCRRILRRRPA